MGRDAVNGRGCRWLVFVQDACRVCTVEEAPETFLSGGETWAAQTARNENVTKPTLSTGALLRIALIHRASFLRSLPHRHLAFTGLLDN
jgi:hypothetical protein